MKRTNKKFNRESLTSRKGQFGENVAKRHYNNLGRRVIDAVSTYDKKKDFTVDGLTVEVKTQDKFYTQNCYTIGTGSNNIEKCRNVDILLIVESPNRLNNNVCKIWEATSREFYQLDKGSSYIKSQYRISPSNLKLLEEITDPTIINEFLELSASNYNM